MDLSIVVHFKRLGSRHRPTHKENEISFCVFGFNEIICKICLKPIQTLTHKHIITERNHTMHLCGIHNFENCVHQKGVTSYLY